MCSVGFLRSSLAMIELISFFSSAEALRRWKLGENRGVGGGEREKKRAIDRLLLFSVVVFFPGGCAPAFFGFDAIAMFFFPSQRKNE